MGFGAQDFEGFVIGAAPRGVTASVPNFFRIARYLQTQIFAEFLETLNGGLGINFACHGGHSSVRRWMFDDSLWPLEEGIRQITQVPAALVGLHERGTLRVGGWADIMIFDPNTIAPLTRSSARPCTLAL